VPQPEAITMTIDSTARRTAAFTFAGNVRTDVNSVGTSLRGPLGGFRLIDAGGVGPLRSPTVDERRFTQRRDTWPDGRPLLRIAARLAFAEEDSRRRLNRPSTAEELRRVPGRYPAD
jgi:hypothetical protein